MPKILFKKTDWHFSFVSLVSARDECEIKRCDFHSTVVSAAPAMFFSHALLTTHATLLSLRSRISLRAKLCANSRPLLVTVPGTSRRTQLSTIGRILFLSQFQRRPNCVCYPLVLQFHAAEFIYIVGGGSSLE